jgi:hypothetical protein
MSTNYFMQRALLKRAIPYRSGFYIAFLPAILSLALFWPFGGGGKKVQMMAGTATPGAQGTVTVSSSSNNNIKMDVKVQDLAKPAGLTPAENVYVLWVQPEGQAAQNEGEVKVDKKENGQIHAETSYKRFKVFITAEQNAQVTAPTGPQVLSADVAQG